jgi:hypothetical protein
MCWGMCDAGGYSGNPVDAPGECAHVDGFPHVLCAAWQGDNQGPHPVSEVRVSRPPSNSRAPWGFFSPLSLLEAAWQGDNLGPHPVSEVRVFRPLSYPDTAPSEGFPPSLIS